MYNANAKINCIRSIKLAFTNYTNFSGRTRRSEYWNFVLLVNIITSLLLSLTLYFFLDEKYISYYDGRYILSLLL